MFIIVAKIQIKPEFRERFLESMLDDARGSVQNERECFHFSVVQDQQDPNRIVLFEVYEDRKAFEVHMQAPHFIRWRDTVTDWYAAPTEVLECSNLYPSDESWRRSKSDL